MKTECLVVECEQDRALVSTPDFAFHWVRSEQFEDTTQVEPGAVVWVDVAEEANGAVAADVIHLPGRAERRALRRRRAWSWVSVAAALLLVLFVAWPTWGAGLYLEGARWYYGHNRVVLALDVNPSAELYVESDGRVDGGLGLNGDGRRLLRGLRLGEPVEDVMQQVVNRLDDGGYLVRQNLAVMVGLVGDDGQLRERVASALQSTLGARPVDVMLVVDQLTRDSWQVARRGGTSVNQWQLRETARQKGEALSEFDDLPLANQLEAAGIEAPHVGENAPSKSVDDEGTKPEQDDELVSPEQTDGSSGEEELPDVTGDDRGPADETGADKPGPAFDEPAGGSGPADEEPATSEDSVTDGEDGRSGPSDGSQVEPGGETEPGGDMEPGDETELGTGTQPDDGEREGGLRSGGERQP